MKRRPPASRLSFSRAAAVVAFAVIAGGLCSVASSQQRSGAAVERMLARCVAVSDARIRLACFDDLAREVLPPEPAVVTDTAVPDPAPASTPTNEDAPAQPVARAAAAAGVASAEQPAELEPYEPADELAVSVIETRKDAVGRWLFFFANGQVWRQLEKKRITVPKQLPAAATVSSGFLGSTNLRFGEKGRAIKIKRLK